MRDQLNQDDAKAFRELFINRVDTLTKGHERVALAYSSGIDSSIILFSLRELGKSFTAYTFHVEGRTSGDLLGAKKACSLLGVNHTVVSVPSSVDSIYSDIRRVIPHSEVIKKTVIECLRPWLYLYPAISERLILNGLGADDLYCSQRKLQVLLHSKGEEAVLPYRKNYSGDLNFSNANIMRMASAYGKENTDVYFNEGVETFFRQFTARAINKPKEKALSIFGFRDEFNQLGGYREHSSYQINSGLAESHEQLLRSVYNTRNSKSVIGIYNDIAASL